MSKRPRGITRRLSPARKVDMESVHHGRLVPTVPVARSVPFLTDYTVGLGVYY